MAITIHSAISKQHNFFFIRNSPLHIFGFSILNQEREPLGSRLGFFFSIQLIILGIWLKNYWVKSLAGCNNSALALSHEVVVLGISEHIEHKAQWQIDGTGFVNWTYCAFWAGKTVCHHGDVYI